MSDFFSSSKMDFRNTIHNFVLGMRCRPGMLDVFLKKPNRYSLGYSSEEILKIY